MAPKVLGYYSAVLKGNNDAFVQKISSGLGPYYGRNPCGLPANPATNYCGGAWGHAHPTNENGKYHYSHGNEAVHAGIGEPGWDDKPCN